MKKIIILLTLGLVGISLLTGCGKSEEEKKMEREDREERLETEAIMRMYGFDDETIEEEMELMEEEQKETRKERIEEEKQEEIERLKREEEAKKEEAKLEAERLERERIEKEKREAEERAWKEREDFMYSLTAQQTSGLPCRIEWWDSYIIVHVTDNEQNLVNSVANDIEDVRYTQIKQNIALWSGEMKEKYTKQFNIHLENFTVKYNYYAGENWFGTAEDGFGVSDYLMY